MFFSVLVEWLLFGRIVSGLIELDRFDGCCVCLCIFLMSFFVFEFFFFELLFLFVVLFDVYCVLLLLVC